MTILEYVIVIVYSLAIVFMFLYALAELSLLISYLSAKKKAKALPKLNLDALKNGYPMVTIQLPVYNELYVMEALLENIAKIDYPKNKLEIQVLDDSTDESYNLTKEHVERLQNSGLDIKHIHRVNRQGFKAGALKEGLSIAKGEYIAIFDADFLPEKDWLLQTLPYFSNENIGLIQTRWGHTNQDYSWLTKIQAFALDVHFTLEQVGRNSGGHFMNFNGTAGIWRKECIIDAGNWEGDTLTEDLDLSYRAQLNDWKFIYLEDVVAPAELPVAMSAAKSQQFRWNKGGAENFQKMFKKLIANQRISYKTKAFGIFHLLNSSMFLNVFIVAVLSIPILYIKNEHIQLNGYFILMSFFIVTTLIYFIAFWFMYKILYGKGFANFLRYIGIFLSFFSVAMGFSLHNTIAVLEGHLGRRSDFIRTPKFNLSAQNKNWKENKYLIHKMSPSVFLEGLLALYFAFGMYSAFAVTDFGYFPFHLMLFIGFGFVFIKSLSTKV
jgi:cellulose synthase/poly-beta-1,6-N-acetylglucosamine synthase-like glycosyltransferase